MIKHTPGPWHWQPEGQFILDKRENIVAEIPCQAANPSDGPLVAAAQELLEACKVAVAALKMPSGNGIGTEIAIENIVRIIAKAEGK